MMLLRHVSLKHVIASVILADAATASQSDLAAGVKDVTDAGVEVINAVDKFGRLGHVVILAVFTITFSLLMLIAVWMAQHAS